MGLFDKKQEISRDEMKQAMRKASPYLSGTSSKIYSDKERIGLGKELFGNEYGSRISKQDYQKMLNKLEVEKMKVKTSGEKFKMDRQIRYLKNIGGLK